MKKGGEKITRQLKTKKARIMVLMFVFLALLISVSSTSAASTVFVNATGGSDVTGDGSKENPYQTIAQGLNSVEDNGTVILANGTYAGPNNNNIVINGNRTIIGESSSLSVIDGNSARIFFVQFGSTLNLVNLTLTGGNNYDGAIDNYGKLTVSGCNFQNNQATYGGAIYNVGSLSVVNSTFTNNFANYFGGAIYNMPGAILDVTGSTFTGNRAQFGGAIINDYGQANIINSTFTNNNAFSGAGGAICNMGYAVLNVFGSTFLANTATQYGGAIYNEVLVPTTIVSSTFIGNFAILGGGAIIQAGAANINVNFCRIVVNSGPQILCSAGFIDATNNWWGSNSGPTGIVGNINAATWIILRINAAPGSIYNQANSTITANLNYNNANQDISSLGHIPDGTPVAFSLTNGPYGTLTAPLIGYTSSGLASIVFTANAAGVQNVNAMVDNQNLMASITMPAVDVFVNKWTGDGTTWNYLTEHYFFIDVGNSGPDDATNVVVVETLEPGFEFISTPNAPGVWDPVARTVTWTFPTISANSPIKWCDIIVRVVSANTTIGNTVTVTADQFDIFQGNNTDSVTITVPPAVDIAVNKTANNTAPNYLDLVTFTVTVSNDGPSDASGVVVNDLLPAGLVLVSADLSTGSYDNVTGVWIIGNLASAANATLTMVAQVLDANVTITNMANLTAVDQYDFNPLNDGSVVDLLVPAAADIQVTKTTSNPNPLVAENFSWTVTVSNNGPNDATSVQISDILPAGLNLVSATPSQGTYNNLTGVWSIGTLLNGSSATLAFVVNAMDSLSGSMVTNTATKSAETQYDWNTSNNVASSSVSVPAKKTFKLSVKNTGTGRIKAVYYVTVYRPDNAAPIFKKYVFYLNPGKSTSFTVGTYAVGTAISTDEMVYNFVYSMRTVSLVNTWSATGLVPYVQNFVVAKVPASRSKGAIARKRFWINQAALGVQIVVPPKLM